jgi:hypothetical protein
MPLTKIQSLGITDGAIVAADIASGAITAAKLASGVGGKVLQVVNGSTNTSAYSSSTSYSDTNLTASITPSSTSNKILILINQSCGKDNSDIWVTFQLLRGATQIAGNPSGNSIGYTANSNYNFMGMSYNLTFLDSPSSTSSITYKTQFKSPSAAQVRVQPDGCYSYITLIEIAG